MPIQYDDIIKDVHEFMLKMREKYGILGGYSPNIEDKGKDTMYVLLSFIHDDFYKKMECYKNVELKKV